MKQELHTLPEHMDPPVFSGVWFAQSLVLYSECLTGNFWGVKFLD